MEKIKRYLGLANNAGYLIIGSDNLKSYDKKLYLVLLDKNAGKSSIKIADKHKLNNIRVIEVDNLEIISNIPKCKIIGIKNKGLSEQIIKYLDWRREEIWQIKQH